MATQQEAKAKHDAETQYFVYGNTRIRIREHLAPSGKTLDELLVELIQHEIREKVTKSA